MLKTISYYLLIFFAIIVAGYAIVGYIILKPGSIAAPEMLITYNANIWNKLNIMLHAGFASLALLTGLFQMSSKWRRKFPKWNIRLRNCYYFSVLMASITGLYLAFIAQGGLSNFFGFGTLAVIWFFATLKALLASHNNRDMPNFRIWIVRSYALTFSAVTLRIYLGLFFAIYGYTKFDYFYPTLGFLCWVPTFIVTEWWIIPRLRNTTSKIK